MNRLFFALLGFVLIPHVVWSQKIKVIYSDGRTTNHIVYMTISNEGSKAQTVELPAGQIETGGDYQDLLMPTPTQVTIPGNSSKTIEVPIFCTDVWLPEPPNGTPLPAPDQWDTRSPLLPILEKIDRAITTLQQSNAIETPLSNKPELERAILKQQTLWVYTAPANRPYTMGDICLNLRRHIESAIGTPINNLTASEKASIDLGIAQITHAVAQVGRAAGGTAFAVPPLPVTATQLRKTPESAKTAAPGTVIAKGTGTGRTTGHIGDIFVVNPTNEPITVYFGPNPSGSPVYIPGDGQYQPYIVPSLAPVMVGPGETKTIPVQGYCTDVRTPPVPAGGDMPPISQWVGLPGLPTTAGPGAVMAPLSSALPLADAVRLLDQSRGMTLPPFYRTEPCSDVLVHYPIRATIPGTDQPIAFPIDPVQYPALSVPLLVDAIQRIQVVYESLKKRGEIVTPFSGNPEKEREAVIQQSFWLYTAALTGNDYKKTDFRGNTIRQFEENTGKDFHKIPQPQQDQLDKGVDDFWGSFEAVGAEAKILTRPVETPVEPTPKVEDIWEKIIDDKSVLVTDPTQESEPPAEQVSKCRFSLQQSSRPEYDIDIDISESAVDPGKIADAKTFLEGRIQEIAKAEAGGEYQMIEPLATTYTLWAINHIGGYAKAVSKSLVANRYGRWVDFINNTEKISAHSSGVRKVTLSGRNDEECQTTIVGTGVVFLTAHTVAFDPSASNIDLLRGINFVGKVAIEVLKAYATGGASLSKATRARKAIKEVLEGVKEDVITEKVGEMLEGEGVMSEEDFTKMVDWAKAIDDDELQEKVLTELAEAMGIDTKWLTFDLEPADFAPVASDTYCKIKGKVDLMVGAKTGAINAKSSVKYQRENLDQDPEEVMHGGGTHCPPPLILSDVKPASLTITLQGEADAEAQAQGNGMAQGYLSSGVTLVLVGICQCKGTWEYEFHLENGFFNGKPSDSEINMMKIRQGVLETQLAEYVEGFNQLKKAPNPGEVQKDLERIMSKWAKEYVCKD